MEKGWDVLTTENLDEPRIDSCLMLSYLSTFLLLFRNKNKLTFLENTLGGSM